MYASDFVHGSGEGYPNSCVVLGRGGFSNTPITTTTLTDPHKHTHAQTTYKPTTACTLRYENQITMDDTTREEEREAFLPSANNANNNNNNTRAELTSKPCGDNDATEEEDMETDFYKHVVVGAELEFGEISMGEEAVTKLLEKNDDPMHRKLYHISAIIFHYTKYYASFILFLVLGPILAFAWAVSMSVIKFVVSWVCYPGIKVSTVLCRPTRDLVRVMLWPVQPIYEIMSRCFPVINFSLWSGPKPQRDSNDKTTNTTKPVEHRKGNSSKNTTDHNVTDEESFHYITHIVDHSETDAETNV